MIVDSTVWIDLLQGKSIASEYLLTLSESIYISRVVVMELIYGLKIKQDIAILMKQLKMLDVEIIEITSEISTNAGALFKKYYHSHGLGIMDAFVAATALQMNESLITHNTKHFKYIDRLDLIQPY